MKEELSQWDEQYGFSFQTFKVLEQEEGVVRYVNPATVVTDVALLKEYDLRLHTTEDLVLDAEFKLFMTSRKKLAVRNNSVFNLNSDILHSQGLTTYFDVEFRECHLPVMFSTSPLTHRTHWQQTTFFLRKEYELAESEVVRGIIRIVRNEICGRNLDIAIGFVVEVYFSI